MDSILPDLQNLYHKPQRTKKKKVEYNLCHAVLQIPCHQSLKFFDLRTKLQFLSSFIQYPPPLLLFPYLPPPPPSDIPNHGIPTLFVVINCSTIFQKPFADPERNPIRLGSHGWVNLLIALDGRVAGAPLLGGDGVHDVGDVLAAAPPGGFL